MNQASRDFTDAMASLQSRRSQSGQGTALTLGSDRVPRGDVEIITPRYVDWFNGERTIREIREPAPKPSVPERELGKKTLAAMTEAGVVFHDKIARALPGDHRMESAILAELIKNIPYLGTCRIGRVPLGRTGPQKRFFSVAEFYVTNFDANLSTSGKHFYNYQSPVGALEAGPKFFGIGIITDGQGRRLSFDKRFGDGGVYYQTKDEALAAYAIASISTGRSFSELLSMDKRNKDKDISSLAGLENVPFGHRF
jgi:hypothetical protein